jgi:putative PEP-CTERM system TPR-repeat lipoprotein
MERVRLAVADDQPGVARRVAGDFLSRHPDSPYALIAVAAAHGAAGDTDGARAALQRAIEIDPGFVSAGLNLARLELASGDRAAARAIYDALLKQMPGSVEVIAALAQLDVAEGNKEAAVQRLEAALSQAPDSWALRRNLAQGYQSLGRMEAAASVLRAVPPTRAGAPEVLAMRAAAELAAGDLDAAVLSYEALVQASPESALPRYQLATVHAAAGRPATAANEVVRGFELDPDDAAAIDAIAAVIDATKDTDARDQLFERLGRTGGNPAVVRLFQARNLREQGDHEAAAALLADVDGTASDPRRFVDLLIRERYAAGDLAGAVRTARVWVGHHSEDTRIRRRLAQMHAEQGEIDAARKNYEAVLDRIPDDVVALNNLAQLLVDRAPREALDYALRARAAAPQSPAITDTLGLAQLAAGETAAAVQTLRAAHESMPSSAEVTLNYARALAAAGAHEEARRLLLDISDKPFAGADAVQELLESLQ